MSKENLVYRYLGPFEVFTEDYGILFINLIERKKKTIKLKPIVWISTHKLKA